MKQTTLLLLCLGLTVTWGACSPKPEAPGDEVPSALESIGEGETITGDKLTRDYVKLLCGKYDECGIAAFQNSSDCRNRITAVLKRDAQWKELHMDKAALKLCLTEFKNFACDDFKAGKSPDSCQKL